MIVFGYPGIGKSTLANESYLTGLRVIDLESSNFFVDGQRPDNWAEIYCSIAKDLSKQNYIVFMSTHQEVRDAFFKTRSDEDAAVIYPSLELKGEWVARLEDRYVLSGLDKDYKAWQRAYKCYEEDINDLISFAEKHYLPQHRLTQIDYELYPMIANMYRHDISYKKRNG